MTNRTWTGQMKQGFNNPWGDLNGFGSGGEYTEEEEAEDQRCVNRTVANINEYKRQINDYQECLKDTIEITTGLNLVLKKIVIDKTFNLSQQEVNLRHDNYFKILSKSKTRDEVRSSLEAICKLTY